MCRCQTQTVGHCLREMTPAPLAPLVPPRVSPLAAPSLWRVTSAALFFFLPFFSNLRNLPTHSSSLRPSLLLSFALSPEIPDPEYLPFVSSALFLSSSVHYLADSNVFHRECRTAVVEPCICSLLC